MNYCPYLFILTSIRLSTSYSVLGVFPHLGKSHIDVFQPLMKSLAERGHQVTVISHFPLIEPIPNYKDINLGGKQVMVDVLDMNHIDPSTRLSKINRIVRLGYLAKFSCEIGLSSQVIQNFMKIRHEYDLLIIEFFNSDCFLGLAHGIRAPIIGLSSSTLMPWVSGRLGNSINTAYIPDNLMDYSHTITFFERIENTLVTLYHHFYYKYFILSSDNTIIRKYLDIKATRVEKFIANTSLILVNAHFSLSLPRPLVPNVIEVGGIHIRSVRSLPKVSEL